MIELISREILFSKILIVVNGKSTFFFYVFTLEKLVSLSFSASAIPVSNVNPPNFRTIDHLESPYKNSTYNKAFVARLIPSVFDRTGQYFFFFPLFLSLYDPYTMHRFLLKRPKIGHTGEEVKSFVQESSYEPFKKTFFHFFFFFSPLPKPCLIFASEK